jgi:thimet oligopeptidase
MKYYLNLRENKEFKVDHSKLQEYFPLQVVIEGTFKIYQLLLGLEFQEIVDKPSYHDELRLFKVIDNLTKEVVGHFYTDLHPRDGKYGHAAVFEIRTGSRKANQLPVCMMVCNFTKPTADQPSLLTHDEVETFFHEFGHVMHQICTKASYYKFGGTNVERDFVEAPSQMLENWVWNKESLKLLSSHYKDGSSIDEKLLDDLIKTKNASSGCFNMRQIMFSKMDQHFHTSEKSNTAEIYKKFTEDYMQLQLESDDLNMNASFEHLVGGYESQYYSYLWSEVYSADMFETRFNKEGILNPKTGSDYRKCILEPGGSLDAYQMVTNFLGREPNEEAFLKSKGVEN